MEMPLPFNLNLIEHLLSSKNEKSTKLIPKLKFYYKLKTVAIELYFYLHHRNIIQMNNIGKNIEMMYNIYGQHHLLFI